ncbi:hypothetical protein RLEG12_21635 [Rhizobium leguminosarum bv. trifolii CB782]|nr:hypothetical protein RLEG12_21635 [Rhizobium leguminosarum bv. trifolii CB782]
MPHLPDSELEFWRRNQKRYWPIRQNLWISTFLSKFK